MSVTFVSILLCFIDTRVNSYDQLTLGRFEVDIKNRPVKYLALGRFEVDLKNRSVKYQVTNMDC